VFSHCPSLARFLARSLSLSVSLFQVLAEVNKEAFDLVFRPRRASGGSMQQQRQRLARHADLAVTCRRRGRRMPGLRRRSLTLTMHCRDELSSGLADARSP
jgi:hypothetical protein